MAKKGKGLSSKDIQNISDAFRDLAAHLLDFIMGDNAKVAREQIAACAEAHFDSGFAPSLLKSAFFDAREIMCGDEAYSAQDVAARFAQYGFRIEGTRVFYDSPIILEEKPVQERPAAPTKEDMVEFYVEGSFLHDVMAARDAKDFLGRFWESVSYAEGEAYDQSDDDRPRPEVSDLRGLWIGNVFNKYSADTRGDITVEDFGRQLKQAGFIVKGGRIAGHQEP